MSDIFIELLYLISYKVCYFAIVCALLSQLAFSKGLEKSENHSVRL